ncbi:hypothetical protein F2Q69_00032243 [Brassica cretica]|uniref:RING-type domain-containing protein n=1 Tax=Brassica cretica TaxID=69181 RepID=A0A8S9SB53_BRACR|nr:hypothetical protein F2Q69_00032243 [Brassica cretica]
MLSYTECDKSFDLFVIEDSLLLLKLRERDREAKRHKSGGSQRGGPLLVDVESGGTTRLSKNRTKRQSDQANVGLNNPRKSKTVAPPVEEPKFNCPICMCPFTEEVSTKCGHIFCKKCIKLAVSVQAKCPTCRKRVIAKDLIRVFLPTTR